MIKVEEFNEAEFQKFKVEYADVYQQMIEIDYTHGMM